LGLAAAAVVVAALVLSLARSPEKSPETAADQPAPAASAPAAQPADASGAASSATATGVVADPSTPETTSTAGVAASGEAPDPGAAAETMQAVDPSAAAAPAEPAAPGSSDDAQAGTSATQADATTTGSSIAGPAADAAAGSSASAPAVSEPSTGPATPSAEGAAPSSAAAANATAAPAGAPAEGAQPSPTAAADLPTASDTSSASAPVSAEATHQSTESSASSGASAAPAVPADPAASQQAALPPATTEAPPTQPESGQPSFDVVRVDPTGTLVIAGRADPESAVTVTSNGKVIGTATADANGEWVILPDQPMPAGNHQLALSAELPDGRDVDADKLVMLAVPEQDKNVAGKPAGQTSGSLALLVPKDDSGGAVVLQQPEPAATGTSQPAKPEQGGGGISSGALGLDVVDYDDRGDVVVGGRGTPGATVQLYLDNKPIGATTVDGGGRWQLTPTEPVAPRLHTLRVDQVGQDGRVAARVESPFLRAERVELPADQAFIVQPGNSLWRIARRTYGEGLRYTVIYDANRVQIRNPDLIYPGQVFAIPPQTQTN
jgi:nucleoid-associated protein YgaU